MTKPFYIDAAYDGDEIAYWYRDFDGTLYRDSVPRGDFVYGYIIANDNKDHKLKSIFGDPVKKLSFEKTNDMKIFADSHEDVTFEMDVPPITRFLIDTFYNADFDSPINIGFYDIEVDYDLEDGLGHPLPSNPFGEINAFQLFDATEKKYVILLRDDMPSSVKLTDKEFPVEIHWTSSEFDLLNKIVDVIDHIDLLGGWYTDGFDLPYIMERAIRAFGEDRAKVMFCRDGFKAKRRDFVDDNGNETWNWTLVGRQHVDMLELFKKFEPGQKDSFGLSAICEEYIGEQKLEYSGDLGALYRRDPQKWAEYAIHDVRLLRGLDNELGLMQQAIRLSRDCCVFVRDVTGSVKPIETKLIKFCKDENIVLPNKKEHHKQKFTGAIVYDTVPGVHKNGFTIDLSGLYPSCLISLGLSTETFLLQCDGEYEDFIKIRSQTHDSITLRTRDNKEEFQLKAFEVWELIKEEGYCLSANGTIFSGEMGLLARFTKDAFDIRKEYQAIMRKAFSEGDEATGKKYDLFQRVAKVFANSIYGTLGNIAFRLFDLRLAESITKTGQMVSKYQAVMVNEMVMDLAA